LLGQFTGAQVVVADFEAGIGTVSRLPEGSVDAVLVVVEPTPKSLEVGRRAAELAAERRLGTVLLVANRVSDAAAEDQVRAALPGEPPLVVPDDPEVLAADRHGQSVLDRSPGSAAVAAFGPLADRLAALIG